MASKKPTEPVLHSDKIDYSQNIFRGGKLLNKGIYTNVTTFTTPPVTLADFKAAVDKLIALASQAMNDTTMTTQRDAQSLIVHGMLTENLGYVKTVANHDPITISLSGFDGTAVAVKGQAPDQPIIKKIVEGKVAGTYKVILVKKTKKLMVTSRSSTYKRNVQYMVESSVTPATATSWNTLLIGAASTKIIFTGLASLQKNSIRVTAVNTYGKSQPSVIYIFVPQN